MYIHEFKNFERFYENFWQKNFSDEKKENEKKFPTIVI